MGEGVVQQRPVARQIGIRGRGLLAVGEAAPQAGEAPAALVDARRAPVVEVTVAGVVAEPGGRRRTEGAQVREEAVEDPVER